MIGYFIVGVLLFSVCISLLAGAVIRAADESDQL